MAKVSHPNVVTVYDVGTFGDEVFIAMEYVRGTTLRQWRGETKRRRREIVATYVQAGRGLEAAHAAGILHRDFKPDNVLVDERGQREGARLRARAPRAPSRKEAPGEASNKIGARRHGHRPQGRPGDASHARTAHPRDARVHGARAAPRRDGDGAQRPVRVLRRALRGALRRAPFEGDSVTTRASEHPAPGQLQAGAREAHVQRGRAARARARDECGRRRSASRRWASSWRARARPARAARWLAAAGVARGGLAGRGARPPAAAHRRSFAGTPQQALAPDWSDARADEVQRAFAATGNARAGSVRAYAHAPR